MNAAEKGLAMRSKTFVFTWDGDDLGDGWFNTDNLATLLFTETHTRRELLMVEEAPRAGKDGANPVPRHSSVLAPETDVVLAWDPRTPAWATLARSSQDGQWYWCYPERDREVRAFWWLPAPAPLDGGSE